MRLTASLRFVWLFLLSSLTVFGSQNPYTGIPSCPVICPLTLTLATCRYDGGAQASFPYAPSARMSRCYDGLPIHTVAECAEQSVGTSPLFAAFANFLAAGGGFGGGTTFTHFTDATGLEGITGVPASSLSSGQSLTVEQLNFGMGSNPFLASAPGDIFVTDLSATASAGELNGIGVFGAKQSFAIQFSQESALLNGATPILQRPGIFTIPGGTTMQGTFQIIAR
jgi:hypothetical protein